MYNNPADSNTRNSIRAHFLWGKGMPSVRNRERAVRPICKDGTFNPAFHSFMTFRRIRNL